MQLLNQDRDGEKLMNERILVTFATRTGSTAGVAEAIGLTLGNGRARVDVLPIQAVASLSPYRAVVVGSAIQRGQWLPEAIQFIQEWRHELVKRPFAAFLVCMTLAMPNSERYRDSVADWLAPVRANVRPVSEGLFAGILEIDQVPSFSDRLKFRMSVAMGAWKEGDHRDWNAIRSWAEELQPLLLS